MLPFRELRRSAFIAGDEDFAQVIPAARDIKKGDACASPSSLILFAFRQQLVPLLVYVFLCFVDHPVVAFLEHVGESTLLFQEFLNRELFLRFVAQLPDAFYDFVERPYAGFHC